jgi:hypothetical protein
VSVDISPTLSKSLWTVEAAVNCIGMERLQFLRSETRIFVSARKAIAESLCKSTQNKKYLYTSQSSEGGEVAGEERVLHHT